MTSKENLVIVSIGPISVDCLPALIAASPDNAEVKLTRVPDTAPSEFEPVDNGGGIPIWERKLSKKKEEEFINTTLLRRKLAEIKGKDGYQPEVGSVTEKVYHAAVLADTSGGITRKALMLQVDGAVRAVSSAIYVLRDKGMLQQIGTKWHPKHSLK